MKRAAITGATGAIGTALVDTLLKKGISVLVFSRQSSNRNIRIPIHPSVKVIHADLSELSMLDVSAEEKCDVFFHLAWAGASGVGRNDMYLQTDNIRFSLDAVKLAKRLGCHTFVGTGSQAEYGPANEKLTADTPTNPTMGYGYAKLCAGQMTRELARQEGLKHIWTRILSVYGPNDGENAMIPSLIRKLQKGIVPEMTPGTQQWDYLFSYDAARALLLLAEKGVNQKTYVLGSGNARPLRDYVETVKRLVAPEIEIAYGKIPFSEKQIMYLCADISELSKDTGWFPETEFEVGIKRIMES